MSSQRAGDRDRLLLIAAFIGLGLWLAFIGPVRTWATSGGARGHWVFGVAPSFLAALTFAHWQAFVTRSRPFAAAAYAAGLVTATEIAQLVLPGYTADGWDVAAGLIGALAAVPLLFWRERRRRARGPRS